MSSQQECNKQLPVEEVLLYNQENILVEIQQISHNGRVHGYYKFMWSYG
jgi:hypothetical protein